MTKFIFCLKGVLLGTLLVVYLCGCGKTPAYYVEEEEFKESTTEEPPVSVNTESVQQQEKEIYIYVCGQIQNPGVYILPEGSRICDLFEAAGGLTDVAAADYWNQARLLTDGEMIYVPTEEEVEDRILDRESGSHIDTKETEDSDKVNINTASKEELMTLPGIGETKALAILAYRQKNGPFSSIEELKNVEGIKDAVFSKMKEYIEIN